jgi:tetratricopeptide (TPR) repeat protein
METMNQNTRNHEELYLALAINTIRLNAINNKVQTVRLSFEQGQKMNAEPVKGIVRTMSFSKMAMRIAAVLFILVSSAVVYKYGSVNMLSLYNQHFTAYELGTTRGESNPDVQVFSYQNANWQDVVAINNMALIKTNKSLFLAGMSEMELKQYPKAAELFRTVLANKMDESFREDAEYYSALAFLANHEGKQALKMINQIKANPDHKYYPLVLKISAVDLKIIELKNK